MSTPFLLTHLSDLHIGADWADQDPALRLQMTVESVRSLEPRPAAVLVSGDLADNATDAEYEQVRDLLAPVGAPLYVLPGNHDDRRTLRHHFAVPGTGDAPINYSVDLGPVRLVMLDTIRPGDDAGSLDAETLAWLDAELAAVPQAPTVIAMHHPPLVTGVAAWDAICLPVADRRELRGVLERHRQVRRLVAGHLHCTITGELAGRAVLTVPSTYVQARLEFGAHEVQLTAEPAAFTIHAMLDGELISYIQTVES
jgi:3',5'-cyclic-AMP phosphodiesterase